MIGFLPTFESIGILAPLLLVVLRFCQGIGVGGEWGGAVLMAVEHAPDGRRGFFGSWPQLGVPAGLLLGNLVFFASRAVLPAGLDWRVPFLLSLLLVGVGLFIRLRLLESPAFEQVKESGTEADLPIIDVVRTYPKNVLLAMGMRVAKNGPFYILTGFVLSYVTAELGLAENVGLVGVLIAATISLVTVPLFGVLSDRVGRKPLYLFGSVFLLLFSFPFFWLLNTGVTPLIWLAIVLAVNLGHDSMYGPQAAYFAELFGTRVRYSGASIGYQAIAIYMALMALITVVSVLLASETYRATSTGPQERELIMA